MPATDSSLKLAAAGSPNAGTKGVDGRTVERQIAEPSVNEKITWQHVIRESYGADQDTVAKCVMQKGGILENDNLQMQILNAVGAGMEKCHKLHARSCNVSPDADWDEVTTLMFPTHISMARKSFRLQDAKLHKPSHRSTNCTTHYAGAIGMFKSLTSAGFPNQQNVDDLNRSRLSMPAVVAIREVYLPIWSADAASAWGEFDDAAGPMCTRGSLVENWRPISFTATRLPISGVARLVAPGGTQQSKCRVESIEKQTCTVRSSRSCTVTISCSARHHILGRRRGAPRAGASPMADAGPSRSRKGSSRPPRTTSAWGPPRW